MDKNYEEIIFEDVFRDIEMAIAIGFVCGASCLGFSCVQYAQAE